MLSNAAQQVISRLKASGHSAYAVGGCVRDLLMGHTPHDWDVCTSALPEETAQCFLGERVIETGLKHGTVTVLIGQTPIEVTTFRVDGAYLDGRHPDKVQFVRNLAQDLSRRDFTVNAMAMDENGGVTDLFDGQEDIQNRLIRCVGDPDTRFLEDALRILRALRFSSVLGFQIEKETAQSLRRNQDRLRLVSKERIAAEMTKLLLGENVLDVLLHFHEVLCVFMPEIAPMAGFAQKNPHHAYDVWTHTAHAVSMAARDPVIRWAVLLHDIGKPATFHIDPKGVGHFYGHAAAGAPAAKEIMQRLKMDNQTISQVHDLVLWHDRYMPNKRSVKRCLKITGPELFEKLLLVKVADDAGKTPEKALEAEKTSRALRAAYEEVIENNECFSLKDLAVTGRDLTALGLQGKAVGKALDAALNAVIDGRLQNDKEKILAWVKKTKRL